MFLTIFDMLKLRLIFLKCFVQFSELILWYEIKIFSIPLIKVNLTDNIKSFVLNLLKAAFCLF